MYIFYFSVIVLTIISVCQELIKEGWNTSSGWESFSKIDILTCGDDDYSVLESMWKIFKFNV